MHTQCNQYFNRIWNSNGEKVSKFKVKEFKRLWRKASEKAGVRIRPQILQKWQATMLGELGVPDRYVDVYQGRAPRTVMTKHYTGKSLQRLKRIYDRADLRVLS